MENLKFEEMVDETVDWFMDVVGESGNPEQVKPHKESYMNDYVYAAYPELTSKEVDMVVDAAAKEYDKMYEGEDDE